MDPTAQELAGMTSIDEAMKWIGVKQGLRDALDETMQKLVHLREIVLCPEAVWTAAVAQLRVVQVQAVPEAAPQGVMGEQSFVPGRARIPREDRPLSVLEAAQVVSLRRVARLRCNQPADEVPSGGGGHSQGQQPQMSGGSASAAASKSSARISEVIDQSDHSEVTPWSPERVRATMAVFKQSNKGIAAKDAYTPTGLQFAALEFKLRTAGSAYVDFGVWRPNGGRLERRMRLTIHHRNAKGDWIPFEIGGPTNFMEWQRGWRVFVVAMRALDEADLPSLTEYEEVVEDLVQTYGDQCWWVVAQGEGRMRSERMPTLLTNAIEEKEAAEKKGETHALDLRRPWNHVFRKAASDREYWVDEVKDKCMRWLGKIDSAHTVAEEGFGPVHPGNSGLLEIQAAGGALGGGGGRGSKRKAQYSESSDSSGDKATQSKKRKRNQAKKARKAAKAKPENRRSPKRPPPPRFVKDRSRPKGKGKGKGLHNKTASGKEICFKYAKDGTCKEPCPQGRAHVCERCLQQHKTADCKQR